MSSIDQLAADLYHIFDAANNKKTGPYETEAEVIRVEDDTVYIHIPGGVDETPVRKTISAQVGDKVQAHLEGGRGWLTGNITDPSTGDRSIQALAKSVGNTNRRLRVIEAAMEEVEEEIAGIPSVVAIWYEYNLSSSNSSFIQVTGYDWSEEIPALIAGAFIWRRQGIEYSNGEYEYGDPEFDSSSQVLAEVERAQESTNNHFWYDNTGVYVTEDEGSAGIATGYATRHTASGILQTYKGKLLSSWTNSGIAFYSYNESTDTLTQLVTYGASGITNNPDIPFTIGNNNNYIKWLYDNDRWKVKICADVIELGGTPVITEADQLTIDNIKYAVSSTETQPADSAFTYNSVPTVAEGYWLWTKIVYSDGSKAYMKAKQGEEGPQGPQGQQGPQGNNAADYYCMQFDSAGTTYKKGLNIFSGYYYNSAYNKTFLNINPDDGLVFYIKNANNEAKKTAQYMSTYTAFYDSNESERMRIGEIDSTNHTIGVRIGDVNGGMYLTSGTLKLKGYNGMTGYDYFLRFEYDNAATSPWFGWWGNNYTSIVSLGSILGNCDYTVPLTFEVTLEKISTGSTTKKTFYRLITWNGAEMLPATDITIEHSDGHNIRVRAAANSTAVTFSSPDGNYKVSKVRLATERRYQAPELFVGAGLLANGYSHSLVLGQWNVQQTNGLLTIGNGSSYQRSNALSVDWYGCIDNNNSRCSSWIDGRDYARLRFHPTVGYYPGGTSLEMHPYISMKSLNGDWQIATYNSNGLYFAYTTDANYATKNNAATGAYISTAGTFNTMSDRKVKRDINELTYAKDIIMNLNPVEFKFKDISEKATHMGFIAQEVATIGGIVHKDLGVYSAMPLDPEKYAESKSEQIDNNDEELMWMLAYDELIAPLVKVVQDQQKDIDELKSQIAKGA